MNTPLPIFRLFAKILLGTSLIFLLKVSVAGPSAGLIKHVDGRVGVERERPLLTATVGMSIEPADRIITGSDGSVAILLMDDTRMSAGPNVVLDLNRFRFDAGKNQGEIDAFLQQGSLSVISGKLSKSPVSSVRFRTTSVTLGVRGTSFVLDAGGAVK